MLTAINNSATSPSLPIRARPGGQAPEPSMRGLPVAGVLDQLRAELVRMLTTATRVFLLGLGSRHVRDAVTRRLLRGVAHLLYAEIDERRRAGDLDERGDGHCHVN